MAEGGARNIGKVFQKTVTRTKEKVLQNLGKADRTKDDQFEQHEANFNEQLVTAYKLQKVLKTYSERLKDMSLASSSLYRTMKEVYSADWLGYTDFCAAYEEVVGTWDGYLSHVDELTVTPLNNYIALFPKYKEKMAKRKRKLTDYDSARHNHDSVSSAKKMDDNKIAKALEELNEAKHIYETINSSIIEELSSFHKSRVHVLSSAFHGLIGAEIDFHKNSIMVKKVMDIAVEKLKEDADKFRVPCADDGSEAAQRSHSVDEDQRYIDLDFKVAHRMLVPQHKLRSSLKNQSANNDVVTVDTTIPHLTGDKLEPTTEDRTTTPGDSPQHGKPKLKPMMSPAVPAPTYQNVVAERNRKSGTVDTDNPPPDGCEQPSTNGDSKEEEHEKPEEEEEEEEKEKSNIDVPEELSSSPALTPEIKKAAALGETEVPTIHSTPNSEETPTNDSTHEGPAKVAESAGQDDGEAYDIPVPKHQGIVPSNRVLFRVKATHNYVGEDTDELTFDAGEVITVVPFDDPDDQDEGWLMGVKETSRERGVFPENFTTRIE